MSAIFALGSPDQHILLSSQHHHPPSAPLPAGASTVFWSIPPLVHGFLALLTLAAILPLMTILRAAAICLRIPGRQYILLYSARLACVCIGIRIHFVGALAPNQAPRLFIANHVSWLDIILLCATTPAYYIASAQVRSWPLFGFMARIGETEFISQSRGARSLIRERQRLERRLDKGESLFMFPEGGRSGRLRPSKFYSTLFIGQTSSGDSIDIVPISLCYIASRGLPLRGEAAATVTMRRRQHSIPATIWRLLQLLPLDVVVETHPPIRMEGSFGRREVSDECRRRIAESVRRNRRAWAFYAIGDSAALDNSLSLSARTAALT